MKTNVMVIGSKREEAKKERDLILKAPPGVILSDTRGASREASQESTVQNPVYEKDWGNEHEVLKKLEGRFLEDRRLYARALYMQNVECDTLSDSLDSEPYSLSEPLRFLIIDLSMGGIGIVCEHEILPGKVLSFKLPLDSITYNIKCEVVYSFQNSDKYRAGLKIVDGDKNLIRHLKIFVARLTLQSMFGATT